MPKLQGKSGESQRALETWKELEGNPEREPLCKAAGALLIEKVAKRRQHMGYGSWTQVDHVMREQDLDHLVCYDISIGKTGVSLELGVLERGERTKAGAQQGVAPVGQVLQDFYTLRKLEGGPMEKVSQFSIPAYNTVVDEGMKELRQEESGTHILRHTLATGRLHYDKWTRKRVRDMGRWAADTSLTHYGKYRKLLQNEERLTQAEQERGMWIWENPRERLGLEDPAPRIAELKKIKDMPAEGCDMEGDVSPAEAQAPTADGASKPNDINDDEEEEEEEEVKEEEEKQEDWLEELEEPRSPGRAYPLIPKL